MESERTIEQHSTAGSAADHQRRKYRSGRHLDMARRALEEWRNEQAQTRYATRAYSILAVLPDDSIESVAHDARIASSAALEQKIPLSRWPFLRRHGQEIVDLLLDVDSKYESEMAADVAAKAASTKAPAKAALHAQSSRPEEADHALIPNGLECVENDRELEQRNGKPLFLVAAGDTVQHLYRSH